MPTKSLPRREFLQLADTYDAEKHSIAGYYISEKLDGTRCFWDGGLTRGVPTKDIPWASTIDPKTGAAKTKVKETATGLWSRYGNPIMAPDSFLNKLPCCPLDGELWAGRGNFQLCRSICGGDTPDARFDKISYAVYSSPPLAHIFRDGEIKNSNFVLNVTYKEMAEFLRDQVREIPGYMSVTEGATFEQELIFLRDAIETQNDHVFLHQQVKLPMDPEAARTTANEYLTKVLDKGGEGCVIRDPASPWTPRRHKGLLKFKPHEDAEAIVVGFVTGKVGKQGNVLGKIGALKVRAAGLKGVEFEIGSGMTMEERELDHAGAEWARQNPEAELPPQFDAKHLRRGKTITFKYRELSDDRIPKEARYWRRREGVE